MGGTTLSGGVLSVAVLNNTSSSNLPAYGLNCTLSGGTLQYTGTGDTASLPVNFANSPNNGGLQVLNPAANLTLDGWVHGGTLYKTGPGTLTLSGRWTTTVLPSTCSRALSSSAHTGNRSARLGVSVSPGATLQFGSNATAAGNCITGVNNMNGTFDFNGKSEGLIALNGTGTITNNAISTTSTLPPSATPSPAGPASAARQPSIGDLCRLNRRRPGSHGPFRQRLRRRRPYPDRHGNAYSGGTTIGGGMLQIGDGSTSPGSLPGNVAVSSTTAGALTFNTPAGMSITASGNISGNGSGGLTKTGAGLADPFRQQHLHRRHGDLRRHAPDRQRHERRVSRQPDD